MKKERQGVCKAYGCLFRLGQLQGIKLIAISPCKHCLGLTCALPRCFKTQWALATAQLDASTLPNTVLGALFDSTSHKV